MVEIWVIKREHHLFGGLAMDICLTLTEVEWGVTKDVAAVIGSVAGVCTVIAGVVFGYLGLITWKKQLRGTVNHEMSRKLLVSIYTYEATLNAVRDIGMSLSELSEEEASHVKGLPAEPKRYAFTYSIYRARLNTIDNSLAPVRAHLLEARALWGQEIEDLVEALIAMKDEWWTVARRYASAMNPAEDIDTRERYAKAWIENKGVLYVDGPDNAYGLRFKEKLAEVEGFLRTKM